jgi:hypothetical protein
LMCKALSAWLATASWSTKLGHKSR